MMELHRKTIEIMERYDIGAPNPNANVLREGQNRSKRPINHSAVFCAVLLALSALAWMFR